MPTSQGREGTYNPTSPHSSSGLVDSVNCTPDTRLTAFSPEDPSTSSARAPHSMGVGSRESRPIKFNVDSTATLNISNAKSLYQEGNHADKDPFVSTVSPSTRPCQKLSPTASCFSPFSTVVNSRAIETSSGQATVNRVSSTFVHSSLSTELELSRCLVVSVQGGRLQVGDIETYISTLERRFRFEGARQLQPCDGKVYVRFSNIRDACLFSQNVEFDGQGWRINYIHPRAFSQTVDPTAGLITGHEGQLTLAVFGPPTLQNVDPNELRGFLQNLLISEGDLFAFKTQDGGVEGSLLFAVVEYCDNDVSLRAVSNLNGKVIEGFQVCMTLHRPDIPSMAAATHDRIGSPARTAVSTLDLVGDFQRVSMARPQSTASSMPTTYMSTPTRSSHTPGFHVQPSYGMVPVVYHGMPMSPTGIAMSPRAIPMPMSPRSMSMSPSYVLDHVSPRSHNAMYPAGNYSWVGPVYHHQPPLISTEYMTPRQFAYPRHDTRRQNATRVHRSPYHHHNVSSQHNQVDVGRIRDGIDVRTTIMLRNIPNKVDQAMLKRIVDESSWGKYDFMYLRIDFANDCNVGYAFINFVDPLDIIDFVNKRGNQRWNCFKSDKVAEISYATIQGKDCLVQKFRNSSVMLEAAHYRPKLYFTSNGPVPDLAGHEEPFPGPDNQSKMKRSCENAEHVGLFTPNAGQHFRDEQRRRRSQYDRGTRLAALEEYDYDPSFEQHHPHHPYPSQ